MAPLWMSRISCFAGSCLLAAGCTAVPRATPVAARSTVRTPDAIQFEIEVQLHNAGEEDIPLDAYEYAFEVEGLGVFHGRWAAMRTLPPFSQVTVHLPAVLPITPGDPPSGRWTLDGDVRYQAPGLIGRILFDIGIQRPAEPFSGFGTLAAE